jgi:hypothetical protein
LTFRNSTCKSNFNPYFPVSSTWWILWQRAVFSQPPKRWQAADVEVSSGKLEILWSQKYTPWKRNFTHD